MQQSHNPASGAYKRIWLAPWNGSVQPRQWARALISSAKSTAGGFIGYKAIKVPFRYASGDRYQVNSVTKAWHRLTPKIIRGKARVKQEKKIRTAYRLAVQRGNPHLVS